MPDLRWVAPLPLFLTLAACRSGGGDVTPTPTAVAPTPTAQPSPVATATPLPPPAEGGYELEPALPAATFPLMLGFSLVPGSPGEGVVLTQDGFVYRVPLDGDGPADLFADVSGLLIDDPQTEEGLLGLAFSPDFQSDGLVYLHYTAGGPRRNVLARFPVVDGSIDVGAERVLLEVEQPFPNHNGGQIAFGPDGYLYLSLGDGGSSGDPNGNGQDLSTLLGSILRLDVSGDQAVAPGDNPFVDDPEARPEIYAYGLRNPWRFSFDRESGDLWAGDVGQGQWEEVDRIVAGGNYGWNVVEGLECFAVDPCDDPGLTPPRAVYDHEQGCSVTGGYVYRGQSMPELDGYYVYADYCSGLIWAVNTAGDSPAVLLADTGRAISSFGELPDGELLVITFDSAVFRLVRSG
ncbi:MAG: PQQ-dependent sugar dehydrogenase [Dehalococcoidia bacterium]